MIKGELVKEMERLRGGRVPFVIATVVRAAKPTSVRPGDSALVLADGTIEGFVGGVCAQSSVRLHAARALETGEALLLRLIPGAAPADEPATAEGVVVAHNPCLSGGSLEIFLEPQPVAARVVVAGDTPIARAVAELAATAGYDVARGAEPDASDAALVVASHGEGEEPLLARALHAGVGYVGLVASPRRGAAVVASLDVPDALRAQVHTPAGLDIGARGPAEIAISILAEIVAERTAHAPAAPVTAVDPVCGMEVVVSESTPSLGEGDGRVYFCCEGCQAAFAARR
ncbi:XdhC family protein [Candidatus Solirubrobacter pratensis]|uniref:XdhC family protein n=1 Tax=Candidatus Solirubrobacter pratensis TaxID=1298857 RepID=UPI00041F75F5|nr:XdhC family protein [Candidatus Solirubrobacter pratensis]